MPITDTKDPLTKVYEAIWQMAKDSAAVTSMVRLGNMIGLDQTAWTDPEKHEISDGDVPEMMLVLSQLTGNLHSTSSTSELTATFEFWLSTGDTSITRGIAPLLWAIFCAMANWKTAIATVLWNDKSPVKNHMVGQASLGLADPDKNRGIKGWSTVWSLELMMKFDTQDLIDQSNTALTPT